MSKRYSLLDSNGCVWVFDSWDSLQSWIRDHSDDSPFKYCDHFLDDIVPENSFQFV